MKMIAKAIFKEQKVFAPAEVYLNKHREYGLEMKLVETKQAPGKDTFKFRVEGKEKDIKSFLSFLRMEGIKIV